MRVKHRALAAVAAGAVALGIGAGTAVPASAAPYTYYTKSCHTNRYPGLKAKTWVHVDRYNHTYTRPWATSSRTTFDGRRWLFSYFTYDSAFPRGYEHPRYNIYGYGNWITAHFIDSHGHHTSCTMFDLSSVQGA